MSDLFSVSVDQRSVDRAKKTLAKYEGRSLGERLSRGDLQGARMLQSPVRAAAPIGETRKLSGSVKARAGSRSLGFIRSGIVGPTDAKRHLVIRPHRIVTPGGRDTGKRTAGNSFVDAASKPRIPEVIREIKTILFGP